MLVAADRTLDQVSCCLLVKAPCQVCGEVRVVIIFEKGREVIIFNKGEDRGRKAKVLDFTSERSKVF